MNNTFYYYQGFVYGPCDPVQGIENDWHLQQHVKVLTKYKWTGPAKPDWTTLIEGKDFQLAPCDCDKYVNGHTVCGRTDLPHRTPGCNVAYPIQSPSPSPASVEERAKELKQDYTDWFYCAGNAYFPTPSQQFDWLYNKLIAGATDNHPSPAFQYRVNDWMQQCFGEKIAADVTERNHRFIEEALELVQATGITKSEVLQLVDYVFSRDIGEINQEIGGVMVTLAALCNALGLDAAKAGETELARVWTKIEKIREKQANKPKHSPLPQETSSHPSPKWVSVDERLPGNSNEVYAKDADGTRWTVFYAAPFTVDMSDFAEDFPDKLLTHDEEGSYLKEGWYEICEQRDSGYDEFYIPRNIVKWLDESSLQPQPSVEGLVKALEDVKRETMGPAYNDSQTDAICNIVNNAIAKYNNQK